MDSTPLTGGQRDMLEEELAYALPRAQQQRERGKCGYTQQYARAALDAASELGDGAAAAEAQGCLDWAQRSLRHTERRGLTTYERHMAACRAARARSRAVTCFSRRRAASLPVGLRRVPRRRGAGRPAARRTTRSTRAGPGGSDDGPGSSDGPHLAAPVATGGAA